MNTCTSSYRNHSENPALNPFDSPTAFAASNSNAQERGQVFRYRVCSAFKEKWLLVHTTLNHAVLQHSHKKLPAPPAANPRYNCTVTLICMKLKSYKNMMVKDLTIFTDGAKSHHRSGYAQAGAFDLWGFENTPAV